MTRAGNPFGPLRTAIINLALGFFATWDLTLFLVCLLAPEVWARSIHGMEYEDPLGLLRRAGAVWASFAVFHFLALLLWRRESFWLALVAGMRLSELFADVTLIAFAERTTVMGRLGLGASTLVNAFLGWFLVRSYLKMQSRRRQGDAESRVQTPH